MLSDDTTRNVDLTPMLDIVFIMLIFFIVTATFVQEVGIDAAAPEPGKEPPDITEAQSIVVQIRANDQLIVQGKYADERNIQAHLSRLHAQNPKASLVIDANPESSTEQTVRVMDSGRLVGYENIAFAR